MADRLDFDAARATLEEIPATDTWDEAVLRASTDSLVQLDAEPTDQSGRRWPGPSTPWLLAIAACVLAAVAVAALAIPQPEALDTTDPTDAPGQTTECPSPTNRRTNVSGGQMNKRFAAPVATAAAAIMLLGACGDDDDDPATDDDGPVTLAKGEGIGFVGEDGFAGQTLSIDAVRDGGTVSGEFELAGAVIRIECADTDTDGVLLIGGEVISGPPDNFPVGTRLALGIREGNPDRVTLFGDDPSAASCADYLDAITEDARTDDSAYVDVIEGDDIETG